MSLNFLLFYFPSDAEKGKFNITCFIVFHVYLEQTLLVFLVKN